MKRIQDNTWEIVKRIESGRRQRAIEQRHPARIDFSTDGGVNWCMWCYSAVPGRVDLIIDILERLLWLYPEWQFRLVIGGGL